MSVDALQPPAKAGGRHMSRLKPAVQNSCSTPLEVAALHLAPRRNKEDRAHFAGDSCAAADSSTSARHLAASSGFSQGEMKKEEICKVFQNFYCLSPAGVVE